MGPVLKKVKIFSDRLRYATLDSSQNFKVQSILTQEVLEHKTPAENPIQENTDKPESYLESKPKNNPQTNQQLFDKYFTLNDTETYVPQWINIDFRLGRPTMVLENSNFHSAWVYFNDQKENLGLKMTRIIENGQIEDLHVFYSTANGKTINQRPGWFSLDDRNGSGNNHGNGQNTNNHSTNSIPRGIKDPPKQNFYLREAKFEESDLEELRVNIDLDLPSSLQSQNCLSGQNTLQISKIAEHVHNNWGTRNDDSDRNSDDSVKKDNVEPYELYTLTCNGRKLFRDADLRTVYHFYWCGQGKSGIPIIYWKKNHICSF